MSSAIRFCKTVPITSSIITYVYGTVFLTFLIIETSPDQFGVQPFCKNVFIFRYSYMTTTSSLESSLYFLY